MILIVDDCRLKVMPIICNLRKMNIPYKIIKTHQEAIYFIQENYMMIEGIILDMGFKFSVSSEYSRKEGLCLLESMTKRDLHRIPVLVNSSTVIEKHELPIEVFGQMEPGDDFQLFRCFIGNVIGKAAM